jgi:hypothetical protein
MKNIPQILFIIENGPARVNHRSSLPDWAKDAENLLPFTSDPKGLLEESARFNLAFEHLVEELVVIWGAILQLTGEEERLLGQYLDKQLAPLKTILRKRREVLYEEERKREEHLRQLRDERFLREAIKPSKPQPYILVGGVEPLSKQGLLEEFLKSWIEE